MNAADRAVILDATRRIRANAAVLADHATWTMRLSATNAERIAASLRADAAVLETLTVEQRR